MVIATHVASLSPYQMLEPTSPIQPPGTSVLRVRSPSDVYYRLHITCSIFVATVPPPQLYIEAEGMPIAGTMVSTTCIAEFYPGVPLQAVQMEWISVNLNSELINFPPRLLYGNTTQINATHFQRTVTINPLQVSDTGNYTCRVGVDGEYVYTRLDTNITAELSVLGELNVA